MTRGVFVQRWCEGVTHRTEPRTYRSSDSRHPRRLGSRSRTSSGPRCSGRWHCCQTSSRRNTHRRRNAHSPSGKLQPSPGRPQCMCCKPSLLRNCRRRRRRRWRVSWSSWLQSKGRVYPGSRWGLDHTCFRNLMAAGKGRQPMKVFTNKRMVRLKHRPPNAISPRGLRSNA